MVFGADGSGVMDLTEVVKDYGGRAATAEELYTRLFRIGDGFIESAVGKNAPTTFKGNPILYLNDDENYLGKFHRYIWLEDTFIEQLHEAQRAPSNLINACSYYGKKKDSQRMDKCYGLIFDLDSVDEKKIAALFFQARNKANPMPNYIVVSKSGRGVHLYYLFDEPLRMYPNYKSQLKSLKYELTIRIWNYYTSHDENVQIQSYDQSFMIAGTKDVMDVYCMSERRWSIGELAELAHFDWRWDAQYKPSKYTKEEAKELFPDWYEKVVVRGERAGGRWTCKRALYDWWIKQIESGAQYGHRYWCLMCLAVYAIKCGVSKKELRNDMYRLVPLLNSRADDEHPVLVADIKAALEAYEESFVTYPIKDIERQSGIPIERNKRNGRKQKVHLQRARAVQDIDYPNGEWRKGNGRKPQYKEKIEQYFLEHPYASVTDCSCDLDISRPTVYKWKPQPKKV